MEIYAYDREDYGEKLSDTVIIGHTTTTKTRLWARVKKPGEYTLVLFDTFYRFNPKEIGSKTISSYLKQKKIQPIRQENYKFSYDSDLTYVFDIDKLDENSTYYYAIIAAPDVDVPRRWRLGYEKPKSFKTMSDNNDDISFGVSSCHDPFKKDYRSGGGLWDEYYDLLKQTNSDFIVACGDQAYVDTTEDDIWLWIKEHKTDIYKEYKDNPTLLKDFCVSIYRSVYRKYWQSPGLRRVFGEFPTYMIWDDHEIMDGWGSYTKKERLEQLDYLYDVWDEDIDQDTPEESEAFKQLLIDSMFYAAKKVYEEYQHSHNPDTTNNTDDLQYDYSFDMGSLGFYTLDMRGHHNYENPEGERILGLAQFDRFKNWIESDETKNKEALFIVSPVPMVHWHSTFVNTLDILSAKDDFRDEWDHESNYMERDKILDLVFSYSSKSGKPVTFISGDVHCAGIFELTRTSSAKAKVFQFTSSGITRPPAPWISELMSLPKGKLGYKDNTSSNITHFKKHCFIARYNFGHIECKRNSMGKLEIWGNIHNGGRNANLHGLSHKRIKIS